MGTVHERLVRVRTRKSISVELQIEEVFLFVPWGRVQCSKGVSDNYVEICLESLQFRYSSLLYCHVLPVMRFAHCVKFF